MSNDTTQTRTPPPAPPAAKRRRWPWILLAVAVIATAVWLFIPGAGSQAADPADGVSYVTEPARTEDLDEEVQADAAVAYAPDAVTMLRAPRGGTVTDVHLGERDIPEDLEPAFDIDGDPVFTMASDQPLYRDLSDGNTGDDVEALEHALDAAGYDPGEVDDEFDWETAEAVRDWRDDHDLERDGTVERSWMLWVPPEAAVTNLPIQPGDPVEAGAEVVTVADLDDLSITVDVDQADIAQVSEEQQVAVTLDGLSENLNGTVTELPLETGDDGTYPVTVTIEDTDGLRVGMQGTASIVADVRRDAVVVPTGAVTTSDSTPTVRVLIDGAVDTRTVELGLVTANGTEIVTGLSSGEQVILSENGQ